MKEKLGFFLIVLIACVGLTLGATTCAPKDSLNHFYKGISKLTK